MVVPRGGADVSGLVGRQNLDGAKPNGVDLQAPTGGGKVASTHHRLFGYRGRRCVFCLYFTYLPTAVLFALDSNFWWPCFDDPVHEFYGKPPEL